MNQTILTNANPIHIQDDAPTAENLPIFTDRKAVIVKVGDKFEGARIAALQTVIANQRLEIETLKRSIEFKEECLMDAFRLLDAAKALLTERE